MGIITESKEKLEKILGKDLISVVLYGSYASGKQHEHSDVDLLIICSNKEKSEKLVQEFQREYALKGIKISPLVVSKEEVIFAVKSTNPLMLSMKDNYKILFGHDFFEEQIKNLNKEIIRKGIEKIGKFSWRIKSWEVI